METLKTIGIIIGSIYVASGLWLVSVESNFYYKLNVPREKTTEIINKIKKNDLELSTPSFTINGKVYYMPDTVVIEKEFNSSYFNIFNKADSTFFHVTLWGNRKTYFKLDAIGNMGNPTRRKDPYPRHFFAFRQNRIVKENFKKIFLKKLENGIDTLRSKNNKRIKRTIW